MLRCICSCVCAQCGGEISGSEVFADYRSWVHIESGVPCLYGPADQRCQEGTKLMSYRFLLTDQNEDEDDPSIPLDLKIFVDRCTNTDLLIESFSSLASLKVAVFLHKIGDDAALDLTLHHRIQVLVVKNIKEALAWTAKYLKTIDTEKGATVEDKKPRLKTYSDNPNKNIWINQLELIPGVSKDTAIRISDRWASPVALIEWILGHSEEDLAKEVLDNGKPLGRIPARRLYRLLSENAQPNDRIAV